MGNFLRQMGANPGRSGHRMAVEAARVVYRAREALAAWFGATDPLRVVFGMNATDGLNLALHGLLRPGDHVVTTSMEHNAVMRPLRDLEAQGVLLSVAACAPDGTLNPAAVQACLRPETRLIVMTHASNVCGTLLPVAQVGALARAHGALLLVDAAQTAGLYPLDMERDGVDLLAFTGHKSLYGPTGTGGLILGPRLDLNELRPIKQGGTGSASEREQQPDFVPDCYESGTLNAVGLAGLLAGMQWLQEHGLEELRAQEQDLCAQLLAGLGEIPGVEIYGPAQAERQTATVAFNMAGCSPAEVGQRLDEEFGILCRVGLHCAPAAHRTLGSFPVGSVRFSLGAFTTRTQVQAVLGAVRLLAKEVRL
jgi:cysteine desulfurase family protein